MRCSLCETPLAAGQDCCPCCGAPSSMARADGHSDSLPPGWLLAAGRYAAGRVLGRGFSTFTYCGSEPGLRRLVAIKEFLPQGATRVAGSLDASPSVPRSVLDAGCRDFLEEGRVLAGLEHPGLPRIHAALEENQTAYLVLEMIEGATFAGLLGRRKALPEAEALSLVSRLGEPLAALHEAGRAHFAVHPEHAMLSLDGRVVLLSPAGAGRTLAETLHRVAEGLAAGYAAPEQYQSHAQAGPATDVYALAATAYHLLTGMVPVDAPSRVLGKELRPAHEVVPGLGARLGGLLAHALDVDRARRPGSVRELLAELGPRSVHALPAAPTPEPRAVAPPPCTPAQAVDIPTGLRLVGRNEQGYDLYENEKDGMTLVHVPATTFRMGTDDGFESEQPAHSVHLEPYLLGWKPVTNAQFGRFVAETGHVTRAEVRGVGRVWNGLTWKKMKGACWRDPAGYGSVADPDLPVVQIAWDDAVAYCRWAGLRLPTEAEWELGARGPKGRAWPWGDLFDPSACCSSVEEESVRPDPVSDHPKGISPVGCLAMAGSVWEWCSSLHMPYPYDAEDGREDPEAEGKRVLRGGSWNDDEPDLLRGAYRDFDKPRYRSAATGFRCAAGGHEGPR